MPDNGSIALPPGEGKTVRLPGNKIMFLYSGADGGAYSLVDWMAAPRVSGTPLHIHRITDEAFYVLEGTFGCPGRPANGRWSLRGFLSRD